MNSAISTEASRKGGVTPPGAPPPASGPSSPASAFLPWHFFVLAVLASATAAVLLTRGAPLSSAVMMILIIVTAGLAGLAVFRTLLPLVRADAGDRADMVGRRTRTSLDRQKTLVLRAIKELEFDKAMGKVSEADFQEMTDRLRTRALGLIKQLEAGDGYRELIERELSARLKDRIETGAAAAAADAGATAKAPAGPYCTACGTRNEGDARFCKACGHQLVA
jgi:zinc-ribbon domain